MFDERVEDGWVVVIHEYEGVDGGEPCRGVHFGDAQVVAGCDARDVAPTSATVVAVVVPVAEFGVVGSVSANSVPCRSVSGGVYPVVARQSCVKGELFKCAARTWYVVRVVGDAAALWRVEGTGD